MTLKFLKKKYSIIKKRRGIFFALFIYIINYFFFLKKSISKEKTYGMTQLKN